jgi:hypothetical protein
MLPLPLTNSPFISSAVPAEVVTAQLALTSNGNGLLKDSVYPALTTMVLEMKEVNFYCNNFGVHFKVTSDDPSLVNLNEAEAPAPTLRVSPLDNVMH